MKFTAELMRFDKVDCCNRVFRKISKLPQQTELLREFSDDGVDKMVGVADNFRVKNKTLLCDITTDNKEVIELIKKEDTFVAPMLKSDKSVFENGILDIKDAELVKVALSFMHADRGIKPIKGGGK